MSTSCLQKKLGQSVLLGRLNTPRVASFLARSQLFSLLAGVSLLG